MKVHFIQHDAWVAPGEYLNWAVRNSCDVSYTRCWRYEPLPRDAEADLLVILGGHQNPATTKAECDCFDAPAELELIRRYVERGRAVVGVCLGAQLVGEAMGARYAHSPEREIGPVRARLTAAGRRDPFLRGFPDAFDAGEWHNDMPGLTADCAVLAESDGCPRQIVRYGRFVYGFQTHMEFTHEIVAEGVADVGRWAAKGPFVQSSDALLNYDYGPMNRLLSGFLDAMMEDYRMNNKMTISQIMEKMIAFSEGNLHDIDHFIRVWTYARTIGQLEGLDAGEQYVLEVAAICHDIACPLCREKYGNTDGRHQEVEGSRMAMDFLGDTGMDPADIDRVAHLVGRHHTLKDIDGRDLQILIEADYIANAGENGYAPQNIRNFIDRVMKTGAGKRLCREVFRLE